MFTRKFFTATALSAALVAGDVGAAQAQGAEAFVGGLLGGFIGAHAGTRAAQQQRPRTVARAPQPESPARAANREIQTALNYFGWNVGVADGSIGPRSRTGISMYQAYLGNPPTGQITEFERIVLVTAYQRAQFGGPAVTQVAARHPDGMRGLLGEVRDELSGGGRVASAPQVVVVTPEPAAPVAATPAVPSFGAGTMATQVSVASHCNRVSLVTSANGGFTEIGTMRDPVFALNEQFCLARGYAMAEGEALIAQIPGLTPTQAASECAGLVPLLQPHVVALSLQSQPEVTRGMGQFILASGMTPADLATTGRVCLAAGYITENLTIALGSALLLHALGETGYGELPAHHLVQGLGVPQRRELAMEWFSSAIPQSPMAQPVGFAPGGQGRSTLINAALGMMASGAAAPAVAVPAASAGAAPAAGMPLFNTRGAGN
jgi:hypothetical protein